MLGGIGYDGFDVDAPVDADDEEKSFTSIGSLNFNTGLRFNFYYTHARYIAVQARYNVINYTNPGGTDFSGDAFSIDLIFGFQGKKQFK